MEQLIDVRKKSDITALLDRTPIGLLLEYHNLNRPLEEYKRASLLIGTCMDNRISFRLPENFAFIIRTGGAHMRPVEFFLAAALAFNDIRHIALIGHTDCKMAGVSERKKDFISGLTMRAGWEKQPAERSFLKNAPLFDIADPVGFTLSEARRLSRLFPKILAVPLIYRTEQRRLCLIRDWIRGRGE